jgi:hypothetical protein
MVESGQSKPSGDEVLILANFYRHDFRDFLDDTRPAPFEQTDILYRRHGDAFTPQDRRAIQEFLFLCEIESSLEAELGVSKEPFACLRKRICIDALRHGEAAVELPTHGGERRDIETHAVPLHPCQQRRW